MANSKLVVLSPPAPLTDIIHQVGYASGHVLYEIVLKEHGVGWLGVLKAQDQHVLLVAFAGAGTLPELLERIEEQASGPGFSWAKDKWPSKARLRQLQLRL